MSLTRTPVPQQEVAPFPFGPDFQRKILRLILLDEGSVDAVLRHLKPAFFQSREMRWCFTEIWSYWSRYGRVPTLDVLLHKGRQESDPHLAPMLGPFLEQLCRTPMADAEFVRDELVQWARMSHFYANFRETQTLWNHGKRVEAMELSSRMITVRPRSAAAPSRFMARNFWRVMAPIFASRPSVFAAIEEGARPRTLSRSRFAVSATPASMVVLPVPAIP